MSSESLGEALRSARLSLGRSVRQQARTAGIDHATLLRWERDATRPSSRVLREFLNSLEMGPTGIESFLTEHALFDRRAWNGVAIRTLRQSHGFSQARLAEEMGVQQSTISKWESGVALPSIAQMESMRKLLTAREPLHDQLATLRAEIRQLDVAGCFASYDQYWRSCTTQPVEYGELWGIELTHRAEQLALSSRDAKRILAWIYASRSYWSLVRGRNTEVLQLASNGIRIGGEIGFDLTSGYCYWIAARVFLTRRTNPLQDRQSLRRLALSAERRIPDHSLPFPSLVRSGYLLESGQYEGAHQLLVEVRNRTFTHVDDGQCGQFESAYWQDVVDSYHKMFGLRSREYADVLDHHSASRSGRPLIELLSRTYDLAAVSKLSRSDLSREYRELADTARTHHLEFAFSTMEAHLRRISGIDLGERCLS
ncbi:MAG: helix-turn-helix domain-containing protein [Armatimonadetes bacterium]|nr:helix-turn-helix domain-containing protein [Armatimonadota bacterium]